jgi:hypothetical protein
VLVLPSRLRSGTTPDDLFRSIASGIGGTAMPQWTDALPEKDIWALVHYVRKMIETRNRPAEVKALRARLQGPQPPLVIKKPPAADGGPAGQDGGPAATTDGGK